MNNKITKQRLSNVFSYEWLIMVVVIVVAIFLWEILFSAVAVSPTTGQHYKYYIDKNIVCPRKDAFKNQLIEYDVFSYDVLEVDGEVIGTAGSDVLSVRLSAKEGDTIFTLNEKDSSFNRAKSIVDYYSVYQLERLLTDCEDYLTQFLKEEFKDKSVEEKRALSLDFENLDQRKIDSRFDERMDGDNRFRKDSEKSKGRKEERARIKKLCEEAKDFIKILSLPDEAFFTYTKYTQALEVADNSVDKKVYQDYYDGEVEEGRVDVRYGINLANLPTSQNKESVTSYFSYNNSAEGIVLMAFNFKSEQPDLQFETISFINYTVRLFSTVLD